MRFDAVRIDDFGCFRNARLEDLSADLVVVGELAATTQVFFLTCHPEFVNLASACGASAQYWSLEDGAFTRADDPAVLERRLAADRRGGRRPDPR